MSEMTHVTLLPWMSRSSMGNQVMMTNISKNLNCAISFEVTSKTLASFSIVCTCSYIVLTTFFGPND